ncbi:MAG: GGDEF domain-containing response regulator [Epsilonproteobacteria bacterium]|nr:GGDEF domain-containing response regulator [Campylobacterota bacterium]
MTLNELTLLYVEDDRESQERMKLLLEEDVKSFYQAFDGAEGLDLFKTLSPDIVVTDINMPRLDGLALSEAIRAMDKECPIVLITAFDDKETLKRAIEIGVDAFISKPVDIEQLYEKLEKIAKEFKNKKELRLKKAKEIENLYRLAHYDALTNIPNRFLFEVKLDQAIERCDKNGGSVTLFLIDLDDFKEINDTYGHQAGDAVLQSVSKNLLAVIRKEDTLARLGGDEFALIVEDVLDRCYIDTLAQKIIDTVSRPLPFKNKTLHFSCSVGIARYPQDCDEKDELYHCADVAMYKAKHMGKKGYAFYDSPL